MKTTLLVLSFVSVLFSYCCSANVAVVVSQNSDIEQLMPEQVANIFLARTKRLPNGQRARPIELNHQQLKTHFYRQISGKSSGQLNAYWATLVFSGKGKPPRGYRDKTSLYSELLDAPGAITYLDEKDIQQGMKVVYVFP